MFILGYQQIVPLYSIVITKWYIINDIRLDNK